jgi:hypothetical protein
MPDGSPSGDAVQTGSVSPDGRYVAVASRAFLAGGHGSGGPKAFVRDMKKDVTRAASDNETAAGPVLSGDQPRVAFTTNRRLVKKDTDGDFDPYFRDVW